MAIFVSWFMCHTCNSQSKWYTLPPKLLCNLCSTHDLQMWPQVP